MDDLQALLDQQEGYVTPTLASYIPTPQKQAEKQDMMDAIVAALRSQAGGVSPVIGGGMGGAAAPTGKVQSANAGLGSAISSGANMGMDISKALRTPAATPYSAPADLAGTSFI